MSSFRSSSMTSSCTASSTISPKSIIQYNTNNYPSQYVVTLSIVIPFCVLCLLLGIIVIQIEKKRPRINRNTIMISPIIVRENPIYRVSDIRI